MLPEVLGAGARPCPARYHARAGAPHPAPDYPAPPQDTDRSRAVSCGGTLCRCLSRLQEWRETLHGEHTAITVTHMELCLARIKGTTSSALAPVRKWRRADSVRITPTLYELITALQDVVGPDDDPLVVATAVSILRAGRLTLLRNARP